MITVNGGSRNQRKYAESMAYYVCEKFNIQPFVEINFRLMKNDDTLGYCSHVNEDGFEIDIKRTQKLRSTLITLAHEMVHVKQYLEGVIPDNYNDCEDYWDRPWEIEAHGREVGLFVRWAEKERIGHYKWTREAI
ncbi:hypothetical protein N8072_01400 [bacterium]|jgi:hypothetical protein|nr:hypothetical protein [bacterium]